MGSLSSFGSVGKSIFGDAILLTFSKVWLWRLEVAMFCDPSLLFDFLITVLLAA